MRIAELMGIASLAVTRGRVIGPIYLLLAVVAGLSGGIMTQFLSAHADMAVLSFRHGVLMTFFVVLPALLGGIGNVFVPLRLTPARLVLPGMNRAGLGAVSLGLFLLLSGGMTAEGASWVMPVAMMLWAVGMVCMAAVLVASILDGRDERHRLDVFLWSLLLGACGIVAIAPVIAAAATQSLLGLHGASLAGFDSFLDQARGPEMMLALVPAFGIVTESVAPRLRADRWLSRVVVGAMVVLSVGNGVVWAHGVVTHDVAHVAGFLTQVVPAAVLVVAWVLTVWHGRVAMDLRLGWACGFVLLLSTGWLLGGGGLHHSALAFGGMFAVFGGWYQWLMVTGRSRGLMALPHFVLAATGVVASLWPNALVHQGGDMLMAGSLVCFVPVVMRAFARPERGTVLEAGL